MLAYRELLHCRADNSPRGMGVLFSGPDLSHGDDLGMYGNGRELVWMASTVWNVRWRDCRGLLSEVISYIYTSYTFLPQMFGGQGLTSLS